MVSHERDLAPSSATHEHSDIMTYIAIPQSDWRGLPQADNQPEIHNFIDLLRRRRAIILACGFGAMILGLLYCSLTPRRYTADAVLELRGYAPILSTIQSETLYGSDTRKIEYQKTTVAKLKLEGLADSVLSHGTMAHDLERYWQQGSGTTSRLHRWLRRFLPHSISVAAPSGTVKTDLHFLHPRKMIQKYLSLIDIEPVHETNLVHIRATTTRRSLSQAIANTHATTFIEHLTRERQDAIQANVQLLQAQATELKQRVTQAENDLNAYASRNKLILARNNESTSLASRHIESLSQMLADATGKRIKSESALAHARKNREDEGSFLDSELVNQLRTNLKQAETEYSALGSQVTAAYPDMRELSAKISALRRAIRDERAQGLYTLQRSYDADLATETSLRLQIDQEKSQAQEVARQLIQYEVLSKEASSLRDLYQAVLKQAKEIEMSAAATTSNIFVADYAGLPTSPSAPKTQMIVIIITFVGFISGILCAYLADSLRNTLTDPDEVIASLDLPILGSVPTFKQSTSMLKRIGSSLGAISSGDSPSPIPPDKDTGLNADISCSSAMITIAAPHSAVAEALRTIRANVLLSSADYPPRVIMMTSSIQGEGKTTMLANLAVTLAQANHRTLMIDGDLRLAGLSQLFKNGDRSSEGGLSDLLARHRSLEHSLYQTGIPNLDILPAGAKAPNPAELLGSESMKRLLLGLKDRYDFILVDTPPVMAVADALLISRAVDSVLFVVRSRATPRSVARDARQKLVRVRARIIGVIVNDVAASTCVENSFRYGINYLEAGNQA